MIKRIFVEKKKGFDVEAKGLLSDIIANLHPEGLTGPFFIPTRRLTMATISWDV